MREEKKKMFDFSLIFIMDYLNSYLNESLGELYRINLFVVWCVKPDAELQLHTAFIEQVISQNVWLGTTGLIFNYVLDLSVSCVFVVKC